MKTIEVTIHSLCDEIDHLKGEVEYWKSRYETEVQERNAEWNERIAETNKGVANALMLAFSITDDANGNLVISKDDRNELAKNWR